jgi:hypothetical protein
MSYYFSDLIISNFTRPIDIQSGTVSHDWPDKSKYAILFRQF